MKLPPNLRLVDLGIILDNSLIICDIHIGIEESMAKEGFLIPKFNFKDIIERLGKIIINSNIKHFDSIIINGDLKHEFGNITDEEWRNTIKFIAFISKYADKVILVKGNHDSILGPIAEKKEIELVEKYRFGNLLICHGDQLPDEKDLEDVKTIIIGHEHPAVTIKENAKSEKFKCYLIGDYMGRKLIVQPSMNLLSEGTSVNENKLLSPFLKNDIGDFEVIVVGDELYDFGKLKNFY